MNKTGLVVVAYLIIGPSVCASSTAEKKPGARDYPVLNPSPVDNIPISVTLPQGWSGLHLSLIYETARKESHLILPGADCQYAASSGMAMFPYQVTVDLPVVQKGAEFTSALPFDRFRPGRCEWHASDLSFTAITKEGDTTGNRLAGSPIGREDPKAQWTSYFNFTNVSNQWCWKMTDGWESRGYTCNEPFGHQADILGALPTARRGNTHVLSIPPVLPSRSYHIVIHDLKAEILDQLPNG